MPKIQIDKLTLLINNLSKSEKRSFKLFVNRNAQSSESYFVQLFDIISKEKSFDEEKILKRIPGIKKSQLSNLKANLFKQILTCLRLLDRNKYEEIQVREQIDFAKILYERGLYKQCLDTLDKAKKRAFNIDFETLALSILYFEKRIESQHVTGSMAEKADELALQSDELLVQINKTNRLSNASLLLYGEYLRHGYIKNKEDYKRLKGIFDELIPNKNPKGLKFYQKLYLYQSFVWYYNMTQDFPNYYKYSLKWVNLFEENQEKKATATTAYIKGVHNVLNAYFMLDKKSRFIKALNKFTSFDITAINNSSKNDISLYNLIKYIHKLNSIFLTADYDSNPNWLNELCTILEKNSYGWDTHRILVFNYKLGCVFFGKGDLNQSILYLNKISNNTYSNLRKDIQSFARILNLIVHFELGNEELVNYQVRSLYRYLSKQKELQKVQVEILSFLRKTPSIDEQDLKNAFEELRKKLIVIRDQNFEKRPFLYLDIISWLEAKIKNDEIKNIIKSKLRDK